MTESPPRAQYASGSPVRMYPSPSHAVTNVDARSSRPSTRTLAVTTGHDSTSNGTNSHAGCSNNNPRHVIAHMAGSLDQANHRNQDAATIGINLRHGLTDVHRTGRISNNSRGVQHQEAHADLGSIPSAARTAARFSGVIRALAASNLRRKAARASA